jgi:hypothetical protein
MHYKNGREAKVGDLVIGMSYKKSSVQVGRVISIRTSTNPDDVKNCNVTLELPSKTPWGTFEQDYSQCDWLLHVEDVWAFVVSVAFTPQSGHDYFAIVHNFASKWNAPQPETRGINAAPRD